MNKKELIIAILLIFVVILSSNTVFAEEITDNSQLQQNDDIAIIEDGNDDKLSSEQTVTAGSSSSEIQEIINGMADGDTLNFEAGEYSDICIYINKNITVNGNGATLIGYDNPSRENTPDIIWKPTNESGYAIGNLATLYIVKTTGVTIHGLKIVGGANSSSTYSNALVYAMNSNNLTFKNNTLDGSSWGLYFQYCNDGIVKENTIKNQATTGFLNFGSARTQIEKNTIINAKNHGIDVRHGTGPNVQVINNTIIGSKEGIYLMHSQGHTAANNTLINCTISSISCYGSSNINIKGNKMQKSRIGILLGGGYKNINVGENTFALDNLPYPPTFVYYVAEAKSDYQSATNIMGTFSDMSTYSPNYVAYTGIDAPKDIAIDYDSILTKTGTEWNVPEGTSSADIQTMINGMSDGDSLVFAKDAVYTDICIYTDKNIKIFGNNATLIGFNNIDLNNVPEKIRKQTNESGYAIAYRAVLYVVNSTGVVVSDLNIKAQYPGYDTTKATTTTDEYKTAGIYADSNKNLVITGCDVTGASWGIFEQYSSDSIISKNTVHDIYTTGIMNFGSPNAIIVENTVTNAVNHGIDTRHGTGPNVTIAFNTISGSKEGIYLMHSKGHTVYNNTVKDCKISGITAYGSGNEVIFNNTISGSRIGIMLGGGYYNVTIGTNKYTLDSLPFPPTFVTYLARADSKYQSADGVARTYSDKETATITAGEITTKYTENEVNVTLTDADGKAIAKQSIIATINGVNLTAETDANGIATFKTDLKPGTYTAIFTFSGNDNYAKSSVSGSLTVADDRIATAITAANPTVYLQAIAKGTKYQITLKDANGKAVAGKQIVVTFNGATYKANTNANGVATVTLKATKIGSLKATISFAGDDTYKAVSKTTTVKITKEVSKITAAKKTFKANVKTKKYTITLKSKSGKAISKVKVTLKVKGKTYKATTNAKGKATFKITKLTKKGKQTAKINFAGNSYFLKSSKSVKLTIK
ncbi:right-handed parallel beta-helix repeat-containing protein [Methanobrevibacter sp.]|uniref:right-handed parallel beta-helix repeat-containing protein n=1 Tax=Methanobrevibacter sp. TaxID=66852 RepID=UPI0025D0F89A|nr:right-handed parallel beta-helix repeat-containing protein [Methanobrevibacter sp.]MBQ2665598.1 right-handed parallel beta-helix repeat-containing protein [Methanobrevibacter sp.]